MMLIESRLGENLELAQNAFGYELPAHITDLECHHFDAIGATICLAPVPR